MKIKSITQVKNLADKIVLVRCDFNVPLDKNRVVDDYKIQATLETINFLVKSKSKIVLMSHLGRPNGKVNSKYSLKPVAKLLTELLNQDIKLLKTVGTETKKAIKALEAGQIVLLENLRFYPEELSNNKKFAQQLASLAQIYVNDAFGVSHRKQASVAAIKEFIPSYAGLLIEKEVNNLNKIFSAKKPLIIIIGGVKIKTKIPLINKLYKSADKILIGGAIANTILLAQGKEVGKSLVDEDGLEWAKKLKTKNNKIVLPIDVIVRSGKSVNVKPVNKILKSDYILDIGPATIGEYAKIIKSAKTVMWNGPMGKIEDSNSRQGTVTIARLLGTCSTTGTFCVVGGGDIVGALRMAKVDKYINWVSTGGGATLLYLAKEPMPGLEKLVKN